MFQEKKNLLVLWLKFNVWFWMFVLFRLKLTKYSVPYVILCELFDVTFNFKSVWLYKSNVLWSNKVCLSPIKDELQWTGLDISIVRLVLKHLLHEFFNARLNEIDSSELGVGYTFMISKLLLFKTGRT